MVERRFGRIVNITSASVKQPLPGLDLSSGARAGLTGFLAGVARTVVHANVTINFLLPGSFDTPRMQPIQEGAARQQGVDVDVIAEHVREAIPAGRFGTPAEFGAACAFLCAASSGFITGRACSSTAAPTPASSDVMARVFITGSSTGLGLLAARWLDERGHEVTLHARNAQRTDEPRDALPHARSSSATCPASTACAGSPRRSTRSAGTTR